MKPSLGKRGWLEGDEKGICLKAFIKFGIRIPTLLRSNSQRVPIKIER